VKQTEQSPPKKVRLRNDLDYLKDLGICERMMVTNTEESPEARIFISLKYKGIN